MGDVLERKEVEKKTQQLAVNALFERTKG